MIPVCKGEIPSAPANLLLLSILSPKMTIFSRLLACTWSHGQWAVSKWFVSFWSVNIFLTLHVTKTLEEKCGDSEARRCWTLTIWQESQTFEKFWTTIDFPVRVDITCLRLHSL